MTKGRKGKENKDKIKVISDIENLKNGVNSECKTTIEYKDSVYNLTDDNQKLIKSLFSANEMKKKTMILSEEESISLDEHRFEEYYIKNIIISNLNLFFQKYEIVCTINRNLNKDYQSFNEKDHAYKEKLNFYKSYIKLYTNWVYSQINTKNKSLYSIIFSCDSLLIKEIFHSFQNTFETAIQILLWEDAFFSIQTNNTNQIYEFEVIESPSDKDDEEEGGLTRRYDYLLNEILNLIEKEGVYFSESKIFNWASWKKLIINLPQMNLRVIEHCYYIFSLLISYFIDLDDEAEERIKFISIETRLLFFKSILEVIVKSLSTRLKEVKLQELVIKILISFIEISEKAVFLIEILNNFLCQMYFYLSTTVKEQFLEGILENFKKTNRKQEEISKLETEELMSHEGKIENFIIHAKLIPYVNYVVFADSNSIQFLPLILKDEGEEVRDFILKMIFEKTEIYKYVSIEEIINMIDKCDERCDDLMIRIINSPFVYDVAEGCEAKEDKEKETIKIKEIQVLLKKQIVSYIERYPDKMCYLLVNLSMKISISEFFNWFFPYLKNSILYNNRHFLKSCKEIFKQININISKSLLLKPSSSFPITKVNFTDGIPYLLLYLIIYQNASSTYIENRLILWSQYKNQEIRSFSRNIKALLISLIKEVNVNYEVFINFMDFSYDENYKSMYSDVLYEFIKVKEEEIVGNEKLLNSISYMILILKPFSNRIMKRVSEDLKGRIKKVQMIFKKE